MYKFSVLLINSIIFNEICTFLEKLSQEQNILFKSQLKMTIYPLSDSIFEPNPQINRVSLPSKKKKIYLFFSLIINTERDSTSNSFDGRNLHYQ